jgi:hypothetical protein
MHYHVSKFTTNYLAVIKLVIFWDKIRGNLEQYFRATEYLFIWRCL